MAPVLMLWPRLTVLASLLQDSAFTSCERNDSTQLHAWGRELACKCLGLHALLDGGAALQQMHLVMLALALQHDLARIRHTATLALSDLALVRYPLTTSEIVLLCTYDSY